MPTGYTWSVANGDVTELRPFAMQLARGMGALVMMRDEPSDALIPERFEPSNHHSTRLDEARAEHARLLALSDEDCAMAANIDYRAALVSDRKYVVEKEDQRRRYDAMIEKVEAWRDAPEGLKEFALDQLTQGRDFDCDLSHHKEPVKQTGAEWRSSKLDATRWNIEYHAKEAEKEATRVIERNAWLTKLRASLDAFEAANA